MDTSKEYIEMCRKATEIQELWDLVESDKYSVFIDFVWCPRQDQLQDMVFDEDDNLRVWCYEIYKFCDSKLGQHYREYGTMEQLWLAFVMWEKYQKKWDGKEWVV